RDELLRVPIDEASSSIDLKTVAVVPMIVQLVARGPLGPRPVAELRFGSESYSQARTELEVEDIRRLLPEIRKAHGRPSLRENRILAEAAREHAQSVCAMRRAAHSLGSGDPPARLRALGLDADRVGEVISRARSRHAAVEALVRSPSHLFT